MDQLSKNILKYKFIPVVLLAVSISALLFIFLLPSIKPEITELPITGETVGISMSVDSTDLQAHTPTSCSNSINYTVPVSNLQDCQRTPINVMLVIDRTGSMKGVPIGNAKTAAGNFVDRLDPGLDLVGLVSFAVQGNDPHATLHSGLSSQHSTVRNQINSLSAKGYTDIGYPISITANQNPQVMVLLTDGNPNRSADSTMTPEEYAIFQANQAKARGIRIIVIGLGNVNTTFLQNNIASPGVGNFYHTFDSGALDTIYQSIAGDLQYSGAPFLNAKVSLDLSLYNDKLAVSSGGEATFTNNVLTWDIQNLACQNDQTVNFSLATTEETEDLDKITLNAELIGEDGSVVTSNEVSTTIHVPDMTVTEIDVPDSANHGEKLNYEIKIGNVSSGDAYGFEITDFLPDLYFAVDELTITHNGQLVNDTILWTNNNQGFTLAGGLVDPSDITLSFEGEVLESAPEDGYTIENTFNVESQNNCFQETFTSQTEVYGTSQETPPEEEETELPSEEPPGEGQQVPEDQETIAQEPEQQEEEQEEQELSIAPPEQTGQVLPPTGEDKVLYKYLVGTIILLGSITLIVSKRKDKIIKY